MIDLTEFIHNGLEIADEASHTSIDRRRLRFAFESFDTIPNRIARLLTPLSSLEFPVEDLFAPFKQFPLCQVDQILELSSLPDCIRSFMLDICFAEEPGGAQDLVSDEDHHEENAEGSCPFNVLACMVAG